MLADKPPVPVTEVMLRGERLARLRRQGVPHPHRFVRSDKEMDRALMIHRMTIAKGRQFVQSVHPGACPWCGAKISPDASVCDEHRVDEASLTADW
jgi:hypothetical protein